MAQKMLHDWRAMRRSTSRQMNMAQNKAAVGDVVSGQSRLSVDAILSSLAERSATPLRRLKQFPGRQRLVLTRVADYRNGSAPSRGEASVASSKLSGDGPRLSVAIVDTPGSGSTLQQIRVASSGSRGGRE
jgi:hypothetical protein